VRRAAIVVDLGFGDAGKGLVTDHLTRTLGATLVVRFNGGAQAGHNVVAPDGRHHCFAQLGAGSFGPGVRTHLGPKVVVHPTALGVEAAHLEARGVPDPLARVSVDERALVITPFHQAANRLRELGRGAGRHGSCGVGVGEAVADAEAAPEVALRMEALRDRPRALRALLRIQEEKRAALGEVMRATGGVPAAAGEIGILEDASVGARWLDAAAAVLARIAVVPTAWLGAALAQAPAVVFEGAQGVLLDEWLGFHPYTTYSTCTCAGALALLAEHRYAGAVSRVGVLRAYLVRHGAGPLPTEDEALRDLLPEPHNEAGPWQGAVRRGFPDALLARYAAEACGGIDALALTHLDALPRVPAWRVGRGYRLSAPAPALFATGSEGVATHLRVSPGRDLDRQAAMTRALAGATAVCEPAAWHGPAGAERALAFFAEAVGAPARLASWGPSTGDVRALAPLFG
jgi:adenylosuccinate synthase